MSVKDQREKVLSKTKTWENLNLRNSFRLFWNLVTWILGDNYVFLIFYWGIRRDVPYFVARLVFGLDFPIGASVLTCFLLDFDLSINIKLLVFDQIKTTKLKFSPSILS